MINHNTWRNKPFLLPMSSSKNIKQNGASLDATWDTFDRFQVLVRICSMLQSLKQLVWEDYHCFIPSHCSEDSNLVLQPRKSLTSVRKKDTKDNKNSMTNMIL